MPTTEPMAPGEVARALGTLSASIEGMRNELRDKPGKEAFQDYRADQNRKHAEQDQALASVERKTNTALDLIEARIDKLLYAIIVTAIGVVGNLITNIGGG